LNTIAPRVKPATIFPRALTHAMPIIRESSTSS
jgi:hypothetical protein